MSRIIREIREIVELSKRALESMRHEDYGDVPGLIERVMRLDIKQTEEINRRFGHTLLQERYTAFARAILAEAQEAFRLMKEMNAENIKTAKRHIERIAEIAEHEHNIVEAEEEHDIPRDAPMYARITSKEGVKRMKRSSYLVAKRIHELIPALQLDDEGFNRLNKVLDQSRKLRDTLKTMHKQMGGSGEGDIMVIFRTDTKPQVSGVPLRSAMLSGLKEAKFWSGTKISIAKIIH
jgi:hypothetical protein